MGDWYMIGLLVGLAVGIGVAAAGALASARAGIPAAALAAAAAGVGLGFWLGGLGEIVGGAVGGPLGAVGAAQVVRGSLQRGGTRLGVAALVGAAGVVLAGLAFVPALGYLEALAVPALGARLRRRAGERYAGLRILARD